MHELLAEALRNHRFPGHIRDFMDGSRVVVRGEPNPLWYALEKPWETVIPECLRMHNLLAPGAEAEEEWLTWIRPWVAKAPIPVVNLYDFCWWVAFGLKWQHDMVRSVLNKESVSQELWDSIVHFYSTE